MSVTPRRLAWFVLLAAVAIAVVIASTGNSGTDGSVAARAEAISERVRCPTCRGQSVADSAAPAATAIRNEIRRRVDAGQDSGAIEAYLVGRYGDDILLTPPDSGVGSLVWILPVVALGAGGAGLAVALRRWSRRPLAVATDADRLIVDRAERPEPR